MIRSNNDKMVEILRRLKPERNGAVVDDMRKRGLQYGLSYGVSVPVIRKVAREYAPDHGLAEYLFRQDIRELKLAAVYVDDPGQVTAEQAERWTEANRTGEWMDHAAMNLFYASPEAEVLIDRWIAGEDQLRLRGALYMAGRRAVAGVADENGLRGWLSLVEAEFPGKKEIPEQAAVYFFCRAAGVSEALRRRVAEMMQGWNHGNSSKIKELANEVLAFMAE